MHGLIKPFLISALIAAPHLIHAQDISCSGQDPDWVLSLSNNVATFSFERISEMEVMQDDTAMNTDNVRGLTLVGPRDSAIIILHTAEKLATVLTQRGQSPIILAGTCN